MDLIAEILIEFGPPENHPAEGGGGWIDDGDNPSNGSAFGWVGGSAEGR